MPQEDKPTLSFAVVSDYGLKVREIIGRTPKGVRLRSAGWGRSANGEVCPAGKVVAEFDAREAADAALGRYKAAFDAHSSAVREAHAIETAAYQRRQKAQRDRETAALAALLAKPESPTPSPNRREGM